MSDGRKLQFLVALLVIAVAVWVFERNTAPSLPSVLSADTKFTPLDVPEPTIRTTAPANSAADEGNGPRRNIFVAGAPPPQPGEAHVEAPRPFVGPQPAPPPPPLQIPVEFYGTESASGIRVALFKDGENVLIVHEGDTFMNNRFRLDRIGNQSADVEEVSSGRHATVPLVPLDQGQNGAPN
jgi:hypothetical protein